MIKTYNISDLFITSWLDKHKKPTLTPTKIVALIKLRYQLDDAIKNQQHHFVGFYSIEILKLLRKNASAVAKINIEQVVDCINDITFFRTPWFFFPDLEHADFQTPDEYMHDRIFEQLVFADSAFSKYCLLEQQLRNAHPPMDGHQISESELNEMIAVLYTNPKEFNSKKISDRSQLAAKIPDDMKFLIFHTYANIREYIVTRCKNIFPETPAAQAKEETTIVYTGPMWRALLFDFSETEAFKGYDQARTAFLYDALDYMDKKMKELNEAKSKRKAYA